MHLKFHRHAVDEIWSATAEEGITKDMSNKCVCFQHAKGNTFSNSFVHSALFLCTKEIFTQPKE